MDVILGFREQFIILQETRHTTLNRKRWDSIFATKKRRVFWGQPVNTDSKKVDGRINVACGGVAIVVAGDSLALGPPSLGHCEDILLQSGRYVRILVPVLKGFVHVISLYCVAGRTPRAKALNKMYVKNLLAVSYTHLTLPTKRIV